MKERTRALAVLFAAAAAAGIFLTLQQQRTQKQRATNVGSATAASVTPLPSVTPPKSATREEAETALRTFEQGVRAGAAAPNVPWALAHGLVAFGPEFKAADGRLAIDVIGTYAEETEVGGKKLWLFPNRKGAELVEPHEFVQVKTLLESGVPLDRSFTTASGKKVALGKLAEDMRQAAGAPMSDEDYHDMPWLLSALVLLQKLDPKAAEKAPGPKLDRLAELALARLEKDHAVVSKYLGPLDQAFDEGTALHRAKRDKQAIYGHPCGGLHLVQAVGSASTVLESPEYRSRVRKQLGVLLFRYDLERTAYAGLLSRHPDQGLLIRVQQLKFFGHLLETLTFARELGLTEPKTEGGQRIDVVIKQIAGDLATLAFDLNAGGVYERLDAIRKGREQSYLDLVGDGCHAIRGLRHAIRLY